MLLLMSGASNCCALLRPNSSTTARMPAQLISAVMICQIAESLRLASPSTPKIRKKNNPAKAAALSACAGMPVRKPPSLFLSSTPPISPTVMNHAQNKAVNPTSGPAFHALTPPSYCPALLELRAMTKRAGILALQGDYAVHSSMLESLGMEPVLVKRPAALEQIGMLVLPGGESTTMSLLLDYSGLREPLTETIRNGLPTLATCAGAILLSRELRNDSGSVHVKPLGLLDCVAERNAYGRQVDSFQAAIDVDWPRLDTEGQASPFRAVFIRAPRLFDPGGECRVLASHGDEICMVRQGNIVAATFHPELSGSAAIHRAVAGFARIE